MTDHIQTKIDEMRKLKLDPDTESAHARADEILCEVLVVLNQHELVNAFNRLTRWYG